MKSIAPFLGGVLTGSILTVLVLTQQKGNPRMASHPVPSTEDSFLPVKASSKLDSNGNEDAQGQRHGLLTESEIASSSSSARRALGDLLGEMETLRKAGKRSKSDYRTILQALIAEGSKEAIQAVLGFMESLTVEPSGTFFFELLKGVDDDRIFPAASRVLSQQLDDHLTSWDYTRDFQALIGLKGGKEGGSMLLEQLTEGGQLAIGAAQAMKYLADANLDRELLEALTLGDPNIADSLSASMAAWHDEQVTSEMLRIASLPQIGQLKRDGLYKALAGNLSKDEIPGFLKRYWALDSPAEQTSMVGSLGYIRGSDSSIHAELSEIVSSALGDSDLGLRQQAIYFIKYNEEFHTVDYLNSLEDALVHATDSGERELLQSALGELRRVLR